MIIPALARHLGLGRVYYHFCRPHESLNTYTKRGRFRDRTPAMAAGVVHRRFAVAELLLTPIQSLPAPGYSPITPLGQRRNYL